MLTDELKKVRNVFTIFAVLGFIFFVVGIILSVKFIIIDVKDKDKTYAQIIDISNRSILVKYEVNHKEYKKVFSVYSSNYYVGKKIKIYYDKRMPTKANISSFRYMSLIGPAMGIIFMGIGGVGYIYLYTKMYKI